MGLRLPPELFALTTSSAHGDLHVAILTVFGRAADGLENALTQESIKQRLPDVGWYDAISDEELLARLKRFTDWELLNQTQDHTGFYTSAADYERNHLTYSLTRQGEAALAGIEAAWETLEAVGALQTSALDAISDKLDELHRLASASAASDTAIHTTVEELERHLKSLADNVTTFNSNLQRLLSPGQLDIETFTEIKVATVSYLEQFCANLPRRAERIAAAVARVEADGIETLHERAQKGANLPPGTSQQRHDHWLQQRRLHWGGLRSWFCGSDARVGRLDKLAREAISSLLRALERLDKERRRSASASGDFRALARWFSTVDSETEANRLAHAAFGLAAARHAHLALEDPETGHANQSWLDTPVTVSPLLRTSGRETAMGTTGRVPNVAEKKRQARARAQAESEEVARAWSLLHTDGTVRLSLFSQLPAARFSRLLELLTVAWQAPPDRDGMRRATSADGATLIRLRPTDGWCRLSTTNGILTGPDCEVHIGQNWAGAHG